MPCQRPHSPNTVDFNVVVINDNSPEVQLRDYLREIAEGGKIHLIEHGANLALWQVQTRHVITFGSDVVLLNSDTDVFHNRRDRLAGLPIAAASARSPCSQ